jgi:mRNA interferase RelE/StbE
MAAVAFTDAALDDLRRFGPAAAPRVVDEIRVLEREPAAGSPLVDDATGFRVLAAADGRWRVVYDVASDAVTIRSLWRPGARLDGEIYAEALERMQAADTPDVVQLARILRRLGRLTGTVAVGPARVRAPTPDYLADALVAAGHSRLEVAVLDARAAFEAWNRHLAGSRAPD